MEVERKQEVSQTDTQSNQGQIQTAQSDLLVLRSENAELTQKYEVCNNNNNNNNINNIGVIMNDKIISWGEITSFFVNKKNSNFWKT